MQTCFRVSQASLQTVFCLPCSGLSSSVPFSTTQKSTSFSGAFSCQEYWECQSKAPRCCWWHALWAGSQVGSCAAGSSQSGQQEVVAVLHGKRALRDVHSDEFGDWEVDQFADALVLRSLRAVQGVWRLLVWGQADDVNAECFSLLGSLSFQTRIPQRTHTQLYGTTCGILDSIHQVKAVYPKSAFFCVTSFEWTFASSPFQELHSEEAHG